jgi:hypothetical protein
MAPQRRATATLRRLYDVPTDRGADDDTDYLLRPEEVGAAGGWGV